MTLDIWPWLFVAMAGAIVLIVAYMLGKEVGRQEERNAADRRWRKQYLRQMR